MEAKTNLLGHRSCTLKVRFDTIFKQGKRASGPKNGGLTVQDIAEDLTILDIKESDRHGRWVLATVARKGDVEWELTFCPTLTLEEFDHATGQLPAGFRVDTLQSVGGQVLGTRAPALMARIVK